MTDTRVRLPPQAALCSVRVIGIGNPDRGDDGIGRIVAQRLLGRLSTDVSVLTRGGDMMSLGDDIAGIDALVFVDAAVPVSAPGRIHRVDLATGKLERDASFASTHALGLADAIALAQALDMAARHIVVYAVEGATFDVGAPMTPEVAAAADEVVERVVAEVDRLRHSLREGPGDA